MEKILAKIIVYSTIIILSCCVGVAIGLAIKYFFFNSFDAGFSFVEAIVCVFSGAYITISLLLLNMFALNKLLHK